MFRFAHPERERAPMPSGGIMPPRFEGYPYLVSRIGKSALRHIALLPADLNRPGSDGDSGPWKSSGGGHLP
jgi:hypothetical protein